VKKETRVFTLGAKSLRAAAGGNSPGTFTGHAAVFNSLSVELFGFYERIAPGAFASAIGRDDVRFLFNHDGMPLARSKAGTGTLSLSEDADGLLVSAELPDTQLARDLAVALERGDLDQMSFGFRVARDSWADEDLELADGTTIRAQVRTLEEVELFDVSVVTYPAYPATDAALRYLGAGVTGEAFEARDESKPLLDVDVAKLAAVVAEARAGKVLSSSNRELVRNALDALQALLDAAGDESNAAPDERETRDAIGDRLQAAIDAVNAYIDVETDDDDLVQAQGIVETLEEMLEEDSEPDEPESNSAPDDDVERDAALDYARARVSLLERSTGIPRGE
jgi:HK97 family phage prohead protease